MELLCPVAQKTSMASWLAWGMKTMGGVDGKLATLVAAVSSMAMGVLLLVAGFVGLRLYKGEAASLPATVGFYGGVMVVALLVDWGLLRFG